MNNPIKKQMRYSIEEILFYLPLGNSFLVENIPNHLAGYFVQELYETLKDKQSICTYLPVVVNLEEIEPAIFFPTVTEQIANVVSSKYPHLQSMFVEGSLAIDIIDFIYVIKRLLEEGISKKVFNEKPVIVVFILYNADVIDRFGQKFKEDLNDLLKENIFSAVIVAKHISRKWESQKPHWLEPFLNIWFKK